MKRKQRVVGDCCICGRAVLFLSHWTVRDWHELHNGIPARKVVHAPENGTNLRGPRRASGDQLGLFPTRGRGDKRREAAEGRVR